MSGIKLDGRLVKEVSRSFYLTLRLLPDGMREVISLGYLLARASDTIADTASVPEAVRAETLQTYMQDVQKGQASAPLLTLLTSHFQQQDHEGERVLMGKVQEVISSLSSFSAAEQKLLQDVTETITRGQLWDLSFFKGEGQQRVDSAETLEEYTYSVAGCVGEFWTEVLALNGFLRSEEVEEMRSLGIQYGKGLQLTNIIRDIPEDYANGRIYIPGEKTELAGIISEASLWLEKGENYLSEGLAYSRKLPSGRLKVATVLPALLGLETLSLLKASSSEERLGKVKVDRKVVFKNLGKALIY